MDERRCALCGDRVPADAARVGPWFVCADDATRVPRRDFLGRLRLPPREGHHRSCHDVECSGCDTLAIYSARTWAWFRARAAVARQAR